MTSTTARPLAILSVVGALAACEAPAPRTPILSVLRRADACFALMTPDNPVPAELGVESVCADPTFPTILASVDLALVVIDYGPDVEFETTTVAPPPELAVAIDGVVTAVDAAISSEQRVGDRAYYLATFRAPGAPSTDVRIAAGAGPGFWTESPTVFAIVPPPITFDLAECAGGVSCTRTASVGQLHARVALPGDVALPIAIHQELDQLALPDPVPATLPTPVDGASVANLAIDVPAVAPGAATTRWSLVAQVGTSTSAPVVITLAPPALTANLSSCGAPCTVARGTSVGLTITAPAGIHPARALVTTRIGGVPQLVAAPVDLVDGVGLLTLIAPTNAIGAWQIDVTVAGYAAPSIDAYVQ
ncbi:MAG: hypothetical protein NT062_37820 [Proteobacteria bacterium]|nr:hypothetical protein [Pseudomonadota bacterium]